MDQRERFEAWAKKMQPWLLDRPCDDAERLLQLSAWESWKAAEAAALERAAQVCDEYALEVSNRSEAYRPTSVEAPGYCAVRIRTLAAPVERGDKS